MPGRGSHAADISPDNRDHHGKYCAIASIDGNRMQYSRREAQVLVCTAPVSGSGIIARINLRLLLPDRFALDYTRTNAERAAVNLYHVCFCHHDHTIRSDRVFQRVLSVYTTFDAIRQR